MGKKFVMIMLLISVIFLTACGFKALEGNIQAEDSSVKNVAESRTDSEAENEAGESESGELTGELTILVWVPFDNWQYTIKAFTEEHPGVTITVEMAMADELLTEEYMEKYTARIMTGEGFDIVESGLVNMERCAGQGVFANLYELMDADSEFHREDYFSCIFEPVETDGILPAFIYNVNPVYVHLNKRLLKMAGLEYTKDTISFRELYELYEKVRKAAGERIFLTDGLYGYEGMSAYEDKYFVQNNLMDSKEYEEYLKMRHELYYVSEIRSDISYGTMKIANDTLCCQTDLRLPNSNANEFFEGTEDMTGVILYESMHGERYFEAGGNCVSISNFSPNKKLAWEFLKFAFSDREDAFTFSAMYSPNKQKLEKACEGLKPEYKEKLFRDIEAINTVQYADMNLHYNLESIYEDYFVNNTITAEECCEKLAGRLYLYKNE